jgi:sugar phosphate isomerase/epimerase
VKLSLSVRIAETRTVKDRTQVPFEQIAEGAAGLGYAALCMRASVVSVKSSPQDVRRVRSLCDSLGLAISMVTGDVDLAVNTPRAIDMLRDITPYLELTRGLGSSLARVMVHGPGDIPFVQAAADLARDYGVTLCHQTHFATVCETVDDTLDLVERVNRPNFGITFEPANLLVCGDDYGPRAIARLGPYIKNAYFQNMRLDSDGDTLHATRARGVVPARYIPMDDPSGVDVRETIAGLKAIGYDGWFTIHQPLRPEQSVADAMAEGWRAVAHLL